MRMPGTGMRPPGTGANAQGVGMVTNVEISARPVTGAQQGMSGMKTAGQGPGRQVQQHAIRLAQQLETIEIKRPLDAAEVSLSHCGECTVQVADKSFFLNTLRQKIQEINAGETTP